MSTIQKITKMTHRSVLQMNAHNIYPCHKHFCLCVEYLNFGKEKDRQTYKNCYITSENNAKYEKTSVPNYSYDDLMNKYSDKIVLQ